MSDNKGTFLAFILGGLIGAAAGILYAPKSGKETRKNIKKLGEEIADKAGDMSNDFKETCRKLYEEGQEKVSCGKDKISEVFEAGKKAFKEFSKKD